MATQPYESSQLQGLDASMRLASGRQAYPTLAIERQLSRLTAILNLFQFVMMALAIGGAVVMLYTGYMYVINPLSNLRDGLRKIESAQFSARVDVASNDEFGQVASGFNRMAATLQSLYGNLEAQVDRKSVV